MYWEIAVSKEQKTKIVEEIEAGQLTRKEAIEKYNIIGHQTLNSWLVQFGSSRDNVEKKQYKKADQRLAAYIPVLSSKTIYRMINQHLRNHSITVGRDALHYLSRKKALYQNGLQLA